MNSLKRTGKRMLAMLLCVMLALTVPVLPATTASAADWLTPYLDKMTSWGVVKGDGSGNMNTGSAITRAEFVAMMNRAYGYTDVGPIPFTDVQPADWFYEDICKAYTAGIFNGTSATTASPFAPITREQAITLIARNMRMDEVPGEIIDFSDGRLFSSYSRGYVQAAIAAGIIDGYTDGTCRPQQTVTRGEAIKMMCVGIGNLIDTPGTHSPGGVFGNLTINCTNVTLKDTIITGDLYISGGISLGDVVLENVQVRGRIVVAGGGSSELGQNSILLRGVDASDLIVDAPTGQYVSVRTEGRTYIENGSFRSDSYLEDGCRDGYGVLNVSLEGDPGASFTLSGNLEAVVNRTPDSVLTLGDAQAASVTVDEKATNSTLLLEVNASADQVNLDVGTSVEGTGDIGHLTINAAGSTTTMLPDQITIRPGLNADISGDQMDASQAQQYSEEPRILTGYPKVKNVAPTSADGIHSTNKKGVVYWGLTTAAVGAIPDTDEGRENLMAPSYSSGFLLSGNYEVEGPDEDFAIPEGLKGLTASGTYFISAVLVDSRGHTSPVYSERFETPDDIVPAFSSRDYPYMSAIEVEDSEVTVMANKNCDMYYALLPMGSTQPSTMDFLSFAGFDDALGYGRIHLSKNKTETQQVNRLIYPESMNLDDKVTELVELGTYDLYLWLTDADGLKSSGITKLTFTTRDKTPPEFTTEMQQTTMGATNVGVNCVLNEAGTVHWAVVKTGTEYPKLPKNWEQTYGTLENYLMSEEAKFQLANHQNALQAGAINTNGSVNAAANITGLERETAYDLYYIAVDRAGNYSDIVKKITVYTEDSTPPSVTLGFSRLAPNSGVTSDPQPYADSDVRVEFSENILDSKTGDEPLELYQTINSGLASSQDKDNAVTRLRRFLKESVQMFQRVGSNNTQVNIDYDRLVFDGSDNAVSLALDRDGKLIITFPSSVLNMGSGSTYFFQFANITDASPQKNAMLPIDEKTPTFTTVSAQAELEDDVISTTLNGANYAGGDNAIDMAFSITPLSTESSEPGLRWDMKLWFDASIEFDLWCRPRPEDPSSDDGWKLVNKTDTPATISGVPTGSMRGTTLYSIKDGVISSSNTSVLHGTNNGDIFDHLEEGKTWEFAIHVTKIGSQTNRKDFTNYLTCQVQVLIGNHYNLLDTLNQTDLAKTAELVARYGDVTDITYEPGFTINHQFRDGNPPSFASGAPRIVPGDTGATIRVALNRAGTVYYLIVPQDVLPPTLQSGNLADIPTADGTGQPCIATSPNSTEVMDPRGQLSAAIDDSTAFYGAITDVSLMVKDVPLEGLNAKSKYYAYFVIEGSANSISDVYVYQFETLETVRPILTLRYGGANVTVTTNMAADVDYIVMGSDPAYLNKDLLEGEFRETDIAKGMTDEFEGLELGKDFTRINALVRDVPGGNGESIYDRFAESTYKLNLAAMIRSSDVSGNIASVGSTSIDTMGGGSVTLACEDMGMSPGLDYILLAVAKSKTGSGDAFRAVTGVQYFDRTAPRVTSASGLTVDEDGLIQGQLAVNFDEFLYYYDGRGLRPLDNASINAVRKDADGKDTDFASIGTVISSALPSTVKVKYTASSVNRQTTGVVFEFTNASSGTSISFLPSLSDGASPPNTVGNSFTITARVSGKQVIIDITPKDRDART